MKPRDTVRLPCAGCESTPRAHLYYGLRFRLSYGRFLMGTTWNFYSRQQTKARMLSLISNPQFDFAQVAGILKKVGIS
jgi:hypothetical protein